MIYIYAVELLSGPSLALLEVIIWSKFVFSKTPIAKKHYKIGVSALFFETKIARKNFGCYYLVQVGVFSDAVNLDQIITSNLDQIITSKNAIFFVSFCFEKCAKMPMFIVFFEKQPKNCQKKCPKKNDNFSHFAKHRFIKKDPLCCNPPFDPKLVFFNLGFLKPKTMMLNQKHNSKSGKNKDKEKRFQRENKTGNPKKRTFWWTKEIPI